MIWTLPKRRSFCFILPFTYYSIASDLKMLPCQGSLMLVTVKISRSSEMKLKVKPCFVFMSQSICEKNFALGHSESCQRFDHSIPAKGRAGAMEATEWNCHFLPCNSAYATGQCQERRTAWINPTLKLQSTTSKWKIHCWFWFCIFNGGTNSPALARSKGRSWPLLVISFAFEGKDRTI